MTGKGERPLAAMARANVRYWPTVLPPVQRGLARWRQAASKIPDERLRRIALAKIDQERFNTEVAATLATLAPRPSRAAAIEAIVPLQVMYDYLDGVSETLADDSISTSRRLFAAFTVALAPAGEAPLPSFYPPGHDDGGYLDALVQATRGGFSELPKASTVAPVARAAAQRCGESQARTHSVETLGSDQLKQWASERTPGTGLTWWEYTAGATASILAVHALIAAAADLEITPAAAADLDRAYLYIAAISTLLDSVVDRQSDLAAGSNSFIGYYEDEEAACAGVGAVVARAAAEAASLRHCAHHQMTAAGVAAYYLSAPTAREGPGRAIRGRAVAELGPVLVAALGIFRAWRLAKRLARHRGSRA